MALISRARLANAGYAMALGLLAVGCSFNFFKAHPAEPYTDMGARALTPEVPVGGPFVVEISGVRTKLCGVWVGRGFVNRETGNMVHQEMVPAGFVGLGAFRRPVEMRLPTFMGPGDYIFKGLQWSDCGNEVFTVFYPDVPFRIINQY